MRRTAVDKSVDSPGEYHSGKLTAQRVVDEYMKQVPAFATPVLSDAAL